MKDGPERELQARYLDRARASGKALGITAIDLVELAEGRATRAADRKSEEARAILERTGEGIVIALDERGTSPTSTEFSSMLETFNTRGEKSVNFVIGGADGLGDELLAKAARRLSFGAMTMPHQLARILLVEQIYRAMTLLSGHPYHRA